MGTETNEIEKKLEIELVESLINNNLYEEALPFLSRLFDKYDDLYFKYLRGKVFFLSGKFNEAISELTTVIAEDSDFWQAYEMLGELYRATNKPELAETYYFKATALNPRAIKSWLGRGRLALQRREFQVAILSFETYLRINKEDVEVWRLLGESYSEIDNYMSAIDSYNQAIELEPTNQQLYEELGDLYQKMGYPEIAKEKYLQGLQVEEKTRPINQSLYYKLAKLYLEEGHNQKAFNLCNELLTLRKNDAEAIFLSGKALIAMGQKYEGTQRVKKALKLNPKEEYKLYLDQLNKYLYGPKNV
ncbi:MAG: tetratricopeptide repeat protein [Candidatus Heimdallarchaeaceae archaeon]